MWHIHYVDASGGAVTWRAQDTKEQALDQCYSFKTQLGGDTPTHILSDDGERVSAAEIEACCKERAARS